LTSYFFRLVIGNMIPDATIFAVSHFLMNFDYRLLFLFGAFFQQQNSLLPKTAQ